VVHEVTREETTHNHTHTHTHTHIYTNKHTHTKIHTNISYTHTHTQTYIYIYTHTHHTHTHTHTSTHTRTKIFSALTFIGRGNGRANKMVHVGDLLQLGFFQGQHRGHQLPLHDIHLGIGRARKGEGEQTQKKVAYNVKNKRWRKKRIVNFKNNTKLTIKVT